MTSLYRISRKENRTEDIGGAMRNPGRWHVPGQAVLYFSSSLPLAILEMKANGAPFSELREAYRYGHIEAKVGSGESESVPENFFKKDWTLSLEASRAYGSQWFKERRSLILEVKSAVLPVEKNYLVNTAHPAFARIQFPKPLGIPLDTGV